jgi:hypothetical protein
MVVSSLTMPCDLDAKVCKSKAKGELTSDIVDRCSDKKVRILM